MKRFFAIAIMAAVLAFAGLSGAAQAGTIALVGAPDFAGKGAFDQTGVNTTVTGFEGFHKFHDYNDVFEDSFTFTVANITALVFDVTTKNHILEMTFALYDGDGNKLFSLGGDTFLQEAGDTNVTRISFTGLLLSALLTAGTLTLKITGAFCSCASYSVPVATPIPPALLLFVTGLGGVGFIGWFRKRSAGLKLQAAA